MPDSRIEPPGTPKRMVVAADHAGFESKEHRAGKLRETYYEVVDYSDSQPNPDDGYPDFVVPLAGAVVRGEVDRGEVARGEIARGEVDRGIAICGIAICLGGRAVASTFAWELVGVSLEARFNGARRHRRRVDKVAKLETSESGS
jgi:ribose 5-phosphate isomerase B